MSRGVRLFLILLVVALPPLLVLGVLEGLGDVLVARIGQGTALLIVAMVAVLWAGIVTLVASRSMAGEVRALVDLAERGMASGQPAMEAGNEPFRRLNAVMDERNRQLAELVEHLRTAPISEDAGLVARAMVAAARSVTNNPTWTIAVLRSDEPTLAPAVYSADGDSSGVTEMHRWAASAGDDTTRPRLIEGPWGQFVAVPVGASSRLVALLLAPWEGRAAPSTAEISLLSLLGEHAAAAIEHALLYGALRTRTDQLNRMAAIQTDFLRGVTHDLQTPLTSIRALADELEHQDEIDTAARIDLQTIAYQADRLRRMVAQLLVMSRLEVGAVTPRQEVFRLEPLIERTWSALRAVDRTFELRVDGPAFLVVADPDRLEQVMWALLDNAVKYSPVGSRIAVEVSSRAASRGELTAEVRVTDRGAGMDDETMQHAFEQFYRAKSARTQAPDGSGVGLYASRGLIEAMGGSIQVGAAPGGGTTVAFTLPAEAADERAQGASEGQA